MVSLKTNLDQFISSTFTIALFLRFTHRLLNQDLSLISKYNKGYYTDCHTLDLFFSLIPRSTFRISNGVGGLAVIIIWKSKLVMDDLLLTIIKLLSVYMYYEKR